MDPLWIVVYVVAFILSFALAVSEGVERAGESISIDLDFDFGIILFAAFMGFIAPISLPILVVRFARRRQASE